MVRPDEGIQRLRYRHQFMGACPPGSPSRRLAMASRYPPRATGMGSLQKGRPSGEAGKDRSVSKQCSVNGCLADPRKRGYCTRHYTRLLRHGSTTGGGYGRGHVQEFFRGHVLNYDAKDCLIWPFARNRAGYAIMHSGGSKIVSNLVCQEIHGPAPTPHHQAAHSCGRGSDGCVSPLHLRWATRDQNMKEMVVHGRSLRGSRNHFVRLSEADVLSVRRMLGRKSQRAIAIEYGVTQSAIAAIATGKSWAWLEG